MILFKDIQLDKVSVAMTMNGAVLPVFGVFIVEKSSSTTIKN